ncbi:trehalose-phosphatase [Sphingomonas lenta]|uniref:Trehalose 6-phosphate phosphatase n=1 Tax=Sphingomonas lenta TaxID=1141887 RepID=A0A2A2SBN1_9SPHN|nr:trehalose-phosphatase [Sphingomonas lenta]PAX06659.1 trehalose-phosphatase [Sphingomonas lenta]
MQSTDLLLGPPPLDLLSTASLFLDFDGTLVELINRPDQVRADADLRNLLLRLSDALPDRVAIVSGRSIEQLDLMLGEAAHHLALAGSHGAEFRVEGEAAEVAIPLALPQITAAMDAFAATRPGVLVERKTLGAGLHYRAAPEHEADALALARALAREHGLYLQPGKMMAEVRADGDKGRAVVRLVQGAAMAGTTPLVFGDDVTDEAGFGAAAHLGGAGVLVGDPRETQATYALPDVAAVRRWLAQAVERLS